MNLLDRFKSAERRKLEAIAAADAVAARKTATRQAELDAWSLRLRSRDQRIDAAVALLADKIKPLALVIESLDLDYPDDVAKVLIEAFRIADARCGFSESHWCLLSPTANTLAEVFGRNLYFLGRYSR